MLIRLADWEAALVAEVVCVEAGIVVLELGLGVVVVGIRKILTEMLRRHLEQWDSG